MATIEERRTLLAEAAREHEIYLSDTPWPKSEFAHINGIGFHYLDWGQPHLPTIVLLHGGGLQAHTWDLTTILLRECYHVIAPDQRGHGDTGWTPDHLRNVSPYDLMREDTTQFLASFGQPIRSLVGMSMGGLNALRFAGDHPSALHTLCIVDIAPEWPASGQAKIQGFLENLKRPGTFEDYVHRAKARFPHRSFASLRYSLLHSLKQESDGSWSWKQDTRSHPDAVAAEYSNYGRPDSPFTRSLWNALPNIETPTLIIRGGQSPILTEDIARRMVQRLPRAELVTIEGAGHNVHSDTPVAFARILTAFIEENDEN